MLVEIKSKDELKIITVYLVFSWRGIWKVPKTTKGAKPDIKIL